jgi:hypothetical protein
MRAFHGTAVKNVKSIEKQGLLSKYEGVYLTDSAESAARWIGFRLRAMGENTMAVIEVEVNEEELEEGVDHSPMMVQIFGVGRSLVSPESIPAAKIVNIHYFQIVQPKK